MREALPVAVSALPRGALAHPADPPVSMPAVLGGTPRERSHRTPARAPSKRSSG